jgi:hypothetical protein
VVATPPTPIEPSTIASAVILRLGWDSAAFIIENSLEELVQGFVDLVHIAH